MYTSKDKLDTTVETYKQKYKDGYGVLYPEGHIIRFYERILKYKMGITSGNMLDFGCGNGTHCCYFIDKGFDVLGVDIVEEAVNQANCAIDVCKENLHPDGIRRGGVELY